MHASDTGKAQDAPLRVSLLGAGAWARAAHLAALSTRDDVQFDSVYDSDPARAESAAREYGFARIAATVDSLLAADADACIVASPAAFHAEQAIGAIAAGMHVLLEKPMATSARSAWAVAHAAQRADRRVMLALGWNYSPVFAAAQRLLTEHPLGALEHVVLHMASGVHPLLTGQSTDSSGREDVPAVSATWTNSALSGGGFGDAQLSHGLGFLFGLVDDGLASGSATVRPGPYEGIELSLALAGVLGSGATVAISGTAFRQPIRQHLDLRLYGSRGSLVVDLAADRVERIDEQGVSIVAPLSVGDGLYPGTAPALAFADLARGLSTLNTSDAMVGARSTEVLDVVRESVRS